LGADFSDLAFEQWRRMLQPGEWKSFVAALRLLPARFGIAEAMEQSEHFVRIGEDGDSYWTPLLDLMKVAQVQEMHT
jgi:hypothetical protein